jgi:NAD(P)-dependent dehydrogenase (short-subunit alcohol dehydrogenase family)
MTKTAAVSQLCRLMAVQRAPSGVPIAAPAPSTVEPPMGRIARPDVVVDVTTFQLSDAARYVTGTTVPAYGATLATFIPPGSTQ